MSSAAATVAVMTLAVAPYLTLTGNYYLEPDLRGIYPYSPPHMKADHIPCEDVGRIAHEAGVKTR